MTFDNSQKCIKDSEDDKRGGLQLLSNIPEGTAWVYQFWYVGD